MKTIGVLSRVSLVILILLLLQISPGLAGGQPNGQLAMTQGSHFPGQETARKRHRGPVEITFTKWITTSSLMEGLTGGDVAGAFVGEVLQRQVSQRQAGECYSPPSCGRIIRLEAMYEVQAGEHSFTALIRGGTSGDTGAAQVDSVILFGWRTGARVHVEFQTMPAPSPTESGCDGAPPGINCFQGTIHIERASED